VDYREAVRHFTDAISIWPDNARAYLHRGISQAALGEAAAAKSDWDRATQIDPALYEAFTARGTQYRLEGDIPKALEDLNRSIALHPSVDAYYQRGQLYAAQANYQSAIDDFDRAIAERPDAPYGYRARSAARGAIGDTSGSEEDRVLADRIEGRH
jgi:tetratricopeptide (TPR) repeat protein